MTTKFEHGQRTAHKHLDFLFKLKQPVVVLLDFDKTTLVAAAWLDMARAFAYPVPARTVHPVVQHVIGADGAQAKDAHNYGSRGEFSEKRPGYPRHVALVLVLLFG